MGAIKVRMKNSNFKQIVYQAVKHILKHWSKYKTVYAKIYAEERVDTGKRVTGIVDRLRNNWGG